MHKEAHCSPGLISKYSLLVLLSDLFIHKIMITNPFLSQASRMILIDQLQQDENRGEAKNDKVGDLILDALGFSNPKVIHNCWPQRFLANICLAHRSCCPGVHQSANHELHSGYFEFPQGDRCNNRVC